MALLTISIPIYNRAYFLERMLKRFLQDKELFAETINLFISDNCSEEDLWAVCQKYQSQGLRLEYNRNRENLGMDGNFEICINKGKCSNYLWILGSDDIPSDGIFEVILPILRKGVNALHLSNDKDIYEEKHYDSVVDYLKDVNVMITFLSANIISTRKIDEVNLKKYKGTYFTQVPLYLTTIFSGKDNVFLRYNYLQDGNDSQNNGGYNFFRVFMDNYFSIWHEFVENGKLSVKDFHHIKKVTFLRFHKDYVQRTLLGQPSQSLDMSGCVSTVWRHFGREPYFYRFLFHVGLVWTKKHIKKAIGK